MTSDKGTKKQAGRNVLTRVGVQELEELKFLCFCAVKLCAGQEGDDSRTFALQLQINSKYGPWLHNGACDMLLGATR